jgi:hypothetical protein
MFQLTALEPQAGHKTDRNGAFQVERIAQAKALSKGRKGRDQGHE